MAHMDDELMVEPAVLFFQSAEVEENIYDKESTEGGVRALREKRTPRFYGLRPSDTDESELKDDEVCHIRRGW